MRCLAAIAGVSLFVLAMPASAHDWSNHPWPEQNLKESLRVGVVGVVPADCRLSQSTHEVTIDGLQNPTTDTIQRTKASLPFTVSCNTPVSVALESSDGGLKFKGAGTSDRAFTTLIPYSAKVRLPDRGAVLNCRSSDMTHKNGCKAEVDATTIDGDGEIEVAFKASNDLMLAGEYQDQVTITLTPALGGCWT